eukprot:TRINITY_DN105118_c0_g1_i1.p2 TRINITY_DN105118_c0_g1~~TRINITY_DN105118_c0_g1_i1.p2  ORF type:complete len:395 (+),score=41.87 TRINITY_DN105118_c0_g1_i1:76-1260(+)
MPHNNRIVIKNRLHQKMEKKEWTEETDVGITVYLNPGLKPIKGKIKARYSDFIVNEIDKDGKLCYISKAEVEKKAEPKPSEEPKEEKKAPALSEEFKSKLQALMKSNHESYGGLIEYMMNVNEAIVPKDTIFQFPCNDMSKGERTAFHQLIKQNCPQFETNTVEEKGEKLMKVALTEGLSKSKRKKFQMEKRDPKPANPYLYFDMMKTNTDTMAAIFRLSRITGKNVKSFMFAGTKDKRGITTQKVCVFTHDSSKTQGQLCHITGLRLGNFTEGKESLQLGDLQGNRFCLALREFDAENETVKKSIAYAAGFMNSKQIQKKLANMDLQIIMACNGLAPVPFQHMRSVSVWSKRTGPVLFVSSLPNTTYPSLKTNLRGCKIVLIMIQLQAGNGAY